MPLPEKRFLLPIGASIKKISWLKNDFFKDMNGKIACGFLIWFTLTCGDTECYNLLRKEPQELSIKAQNVQ